MMSTKVTMPVEVNPPQVSSFSLEILSGWFKQKHQELLIGQLIVGHIVAFSPVRLIYGCSSYTTSSSDRTVKWMQLSDCILSSISIILAVNELQLSHNVHSLLRFFSSRKS